MIDPVEAVELAGPLGAPPEPGEVVALHRVPVVDRQPPVLALGRAFVRRRAQPLVQAEQRPVRPHVRRIEPDHERQIAHQLDARRAGVAPRLAPLPIELPLQPRLAQQLVRVLAPQGGQRPRLALARAARPVQPPLVGLPVEDGEQRVLVEPVAVLAHERGELLRAPRLLAPFVAQEALERDRDAGVLDGAHGGPVDPRRRRGRRDPLPDLRRTAPPARPRPRSPRTRRATCRPDPARTPTAPSTGWDRRATRG